MTNTQNSGLETAASAPDSSGTQDGKTTNDVEGDGGTHATSTIDGQRRILLFGASATQASHQRRSLFRC